MRESIAAMALFFRPLYTAHSIPYVELSVAPGVVGHGTRGRIRARRRNQMATDLFGRQCGINVQHESDEISRVTCSL